MTILARFQKHDVEILDVFPGTSGVKLATVRALQGKPFQSWTSGGWCESDTANLPAGLLKDITPQPESQSNSPTLLDLALAQAKPQWYNGESVWIWRNGKGSAFLKAYTGEVRLHLTGYTPSIVVFLLDRNGWRASNVVQADYQAWAAKAQEALK